ncbi:CDP-alcohol phosphatidyltransferase family protein [Actinocorallia sp. A-T 12471]|uniref:CDP-alcohol phosphatidyltransferase family protein n=1 Tax=Actinocorallia sp. A-T 12471 TaxID=3089813 RepID=UPI0029CAE11A|nr:CDP-alcohol phosphatidyltransferase family protein [Actinocorallia sp. A-T 12471]MDX6745102.1 CDP-alcohol phosphatidyltransferase family protein [Actinocorallia sp. A-T 12471]
MTFVVLATEPGDPTAELDFSAGTTLLDRLLGQLAAIKVADVRVVARPRAAEVLRKNGADARGLTVVESADVAGDLLEIGRIARAKGEITLAHADLVVSDELLARLARDKGTTAITAKQPVTGTRPAVRISGRRVVSAGSRFHQVTDPDGVFRGLLKVVESQALADVCERLTMLVDMLPEVEPVRVLGKERARNLDVFVDTTARDELDKSVSQHRVLGTTAPDEPDTLALVLVGLVRSGVRVAARNVDDLVCERALTPEQAAAAREAVEAIDEDKVRLNAAVKADDGWFTTYFVSTYSRYIARWAAKRGLTPNAVTCISMGTAAIAALWFAEGTRLGLVLGAVLLYFAFVFDCVDGQVARYTRQYSTLGAWLDATFDRGKEYLAYAGLAVGYGATHSGDVWGLACAVIILQTCRHMVDFSFAVHKGSIPPAPIRELPLDVPDDSLLDPAPASRHAAPRKGLGMLAVRFSAALERVPGARWGKKIIILPIGERFALIALTAAFFDARVTFLALLAWGGLAAAYTLSGRILRSLA